MIPTGSRRRPASEAEPSRRSTRDRLRAARADPVRPHHRGEHRVREQRGARLQRRGHRGSQAGQHTQLYHFTAFGKWLIIAFFFINYLQWSLF